MTQHHHEHRRRWLVVTSIAVAVTLLGIVGGPWVYARFLAPEARAPLALSTSAPAEDAPTPEEPFVADGAWQAAQGSEAGYRLDEVLSGSPVTVVGRTSDVVAELLVEGGALTTATVTVDTASITTDESARDAYYRRAMDTSQFPQATFTLTAPVDVSALSDGGTVSLDAPGTLTFHGVSRPVTASLVAQRTGAGVTASATVPVTLEDFDLTAPDLGFVTVQPMGTVEILLVLEPVP